MADDKELEIRDIDEDGKIETWEIEAAKGKDPFGDDYTGRDTMKRVKKAYGGMVKKYGHGGMVKKYRGGGEVKSYPNEGLRALAKEAPEVVERMGFRKGGLAKGKKCKHRGKVRGTGAAIRGAKFTGVK